MALAAAFALLLGGCTPQSEPVRPKPSPSASPIFASDDEALAAATKAYAAYLEVSDEIAQDGGKNPERIGGFVSADWLPSEISDFGEFAGSGHRQVGSSSFDNMKLFAAQYGFNFPYVVDESQDVARAQVQGVALVSPVGLRVLVLPARSAHSRPAR